MSSRRMFSTCSKEIPMPAGYCNKNDNKMPRPPSQQQRIQESIQPTRPNHYVLDIQEYTFDDLLQLFDMRNSAFGLEELKRAKRKVLQLHPDKSGMAPEYFIFYKKAYDILASFYTNNHKMEEDVSNENPNTEYKHVSSNVLDSTYDKNIYKKINSTIQEITPTEFNRQFNNLFENSNVTKKPDPKRNEWFSGNSTDDPFATYSDKVNSTNINSVVEQMKKHVRNDLVLHQTTRELYSSSFGNSYYDDDEGEDNQSITSSNRITTSTQQSKYVECDPFSKLKYEDLRKVHKDQTIFAVGESDYENVTKYRNIQEYNNVRSSQNMTPLNKADGEQILLQQERIWKEQMANKQHLAELRTQQNIEKNKSVLSAFLQIGN